MDKYNHEGYPDPTAYEALSSIALAEKPKGPYRPIVYVASPFSGDTAGNTSKARAFCRFAVDHGCLPIAPHLHYPQFLDDENDEERKLGCLFAIVLLGKCDELWVFGDTISKGMAGEISRAKRRGMPIKYYNNDCEVIPAWS